MDKRLLSILCCPVTHKGLSLAKADLLARVNKAIGNGILQNSDGQAVSGALKEALVTDDGKILRIEQLETRLEQLNDEISTAGQAGDVETVERLGNEYHQLNAELNQQLEMWEHVGNQLTDMEQ